MGEINVPDMDFLVGDAQLGPVLSVLVTSSGDYVITGHSFGFLSYFRRMYNHSLIRLTSMQLSSSSVRSLLQATSDFVFALQENGTLTRVPSDLEQDGNEPLIVDSGIICGAVSIPHSMCLVRDNMLAIAGRSSAVLI